MDIWLRKIVLLLLIGCLPSAALAHTVKTNHTDVNLWSTPGRDEGDTIGKVQQFEEVEFIGKKKLPNGEIWYQVELARHPGWRKQKQTGWVDSKFFNEISDPTSDDQPSAKESVAPPQPPCPGQKSEIIPEADSFKQIAGRLDPAKGSKKFIWPVGGTIRSGFGMRRHPVTGLVKLHNGTDISGNNGKSVVAAKAGIVTVSRGGCRRGRLRCNGGAGNMITIDHGDGTQTKYLHLNESCPLIRSGTRVAQGQKIACVGSTGASTGPHLHFGVIVKGRYVNPLTVLPRRNEE